MFFKAIQVSSVAIGLLAYASFPVFTVFLEPLLTRERWDPASLGYAFLCVLGIYMIIPGFDPSDAVVRGGGPPPVHRRNEECPGQDGEHPELARAGLRHPPRSALP